MKREKLDAMKRSLQEFLTKGGPYWFSAVLAGAVAVGYTKLFNVAERLCLSLYHYNHYLLFLATPLAFLAAWLLVLRFSPEAAGSGIPQVMAAYELSAQDGDGRLQRLIGLKAMLVKVASSSIAVLGGGAVGREGPTIQVSAAVFQAVMSRFRRYVPKLNPRTWIAAGGAAGLAAAFNTPLGGIVYALEELSSESFHQFKTAVIAAVIVCGVVAEWLSGPYLYLGYPKLGSVTLGILPLAMFIGVLAGAGGAFLGRLLFSVQDLRRKWCPTFRRQVIWVVGCSLLFCLLPLLAGDRALGPGKRLIEDHLFHAAPSGLLLLGSRFVGNLLTYASGCAGGIFAPSLATGATFGEIVAQWLNLPNGNLLAVLGMIAFLTGVTRAPFTAFVLVLEMTDRHSAILPMMLSALVASAAATLVDHRSFYGRVKNRYLETSQESNTALQPSAAYPLP